MSGIYRVYTRTTEEARQEQRWAGSMAQVREHKAALMEKHGLARKHVEHEELEISFSKSGVIEFLNEHCTGLSADQKAA